MRTAPGDPKRDKTIQWSPLWLALILSVGGCATASLEPTAATPTPSPLHAEIERLAEAGDIEAQYRLARIHDDGDGVKRDIDKAIAWYRKAAEGGHTEAQAELGAIYMAGRGTSRNRNEGRKWLHTAAHAGDPNAQYEVATIYASGLGVEKDLAEAERWYRQAAEQGHLEARDRLHAVEAAKARLEHLDRTRQAAEAGNADAQHELATVYLYGLGVGVDAGRAIQWYRKAAEQGHVQAQFELGNAHARGRGVDADLSKAARWWRKASAGGHAQAKASLLSVRELQAIVKAAERGDANAQYALAERYRSGRDVTRDTKLAVLWYRRAAQAGHVQAQFELAEMHRMGVGADQDVDEAVRWYRLALASGHPDAAERLRPFEELDALIKAANQGDPDAQHELSQRYRSGREAPHDPKLAERWWRAWAQNRYGTIGIVVPRRSSEDEVALERAKRDYHLTPGDTTNVLFIDLALHVMDLRDWLAGMPRTGEAKRAAKVLRREVSRLCNALEGKLERASRETLPNRIERPVLGSEQTSGRYSWLPAQGIDTLLEVTLQAVGLREHGSRGSRQFQLMLVAGSRLIAGADGSVIAKTEVVHEGAAHDISYWLDDESRPFQEALDKGAEDLARRIAGNIWNRRTTPGGVE